jgi:Trehalose and maltose hydrolases (possible phosphorylases)
MRSDGEILSFNPSIPENWNHYSFQVFYRGAMIRVDVSQQEAQIRVVSGDPVKLKINGEEIQVDQPGVFFSIKDKETIG